MANKIVVVVDDELGQPIEALSGKVRQLKERLETTICSMKGFAPHFVVNGNAAKVYVKEHAHQVKLVLLDMWLQSPPHGDEVFAALAGAHRHLPIIALSAIAKRAHKRDQDNCPIKADLLTLQKDGLRDWVSKDELLQMKIKDIPHMFASAIDDPENQQKELILDIERKAVVVRVIKTGEVLVDKLILDQEACPDDWMTSAAPAPTAKQALLRLLYKFAKNRKPDKGVSLFDREPPLIFVGQEPRKKRALDEKADLAMQNTDMAEFNKERYAFNEDLQSLSGYRLSGTVLYGEQGGKNGMHRLRIRDVKLPPEMNTPVIVANPVANAAQMHKEIVDGIRGLRNDIERLEKKLDTLRDTAWMRRA